MGNAHIIWVYEDGIRSGWDMDHKKQPDWDTLAPQVGEAVLTVTLDFLNRETDGIVDQPVGHHGNCVNWCDDPHSSDQHLYLWAGNRLVRVDQARDDELELVESLLIKERSDRAARGGRREGPGRRRPR